MDTLEKGRKGEAIYEKVEALIAGGAMTRSQAFDIVAEEYGDKARTVSANYYRVARLTHEREGTESQYARVRRKKSERGEVGAALDEAIEDLERNLNALKRARELYDKVDTEAAALRRIKNLLIE